jgi:hypothetical protein
MGGCRGCGNQLTGTYYEMTRLGASVIAAASDAVHREETMLPNRGSVGSGPVSIVSFDRAIAVRYQKFVLRGRAFLLMEVVSGNQIEDKLFSRLTNQLLIDLLKLMMSIVEYDLMRW